VECGRILYSFWDFGCGNDNLDWNDLQMSFNVIKIGTNRKLVYDFLLVVYSIFAVGLSRTVYEKFDVKQSSYDLEISPRLSTVVSPKSCRVISY